MNVNSLNGYEGNSSGEPWQQTMMKNLCCLNLPKMHWDNPSALGRRELPRLEMAYKYLAGVALARIVLNMCCDLFDYSPGSDLLTVAFGLASANDVKGMNGTFLVLVMIWGGFSGLGLDGLSLLGNFQSWNVGMAGGLFHNLGFMIDTVLLLPASIVLQVWMAKTAHSVLKDMIPDWYDILTYGSPQNAATARREGAMGARAPMLGGGNNVQGFTTASSVQPASSRPAQQTFVPFQGGGQKLGGGPPPGAGTRL